VSPRYCGNGSSDCLREIVFPKVCRFAINPYNGLATVVRQVRPKGQILIGDLIYVRLRGHVRAFVAPIVSVQHDAGRQLILHSEARQLHVG